MRFILCLLLLFSFSSQDSAGIVYLYRVEEVDKFNSGKPKVYLNDKHVFSMPESEYVGLKLKPGQYVFRMQNKASETPLTIEAGRVYYIRVSEIVGHGYQRSLFVTSEEQAKYHMKDLKPLEGKNIKDKALEVVSEK